MNYITKYITYGLIDKKLNGQGVGMRQAIFNE